MITWKITQNLTDALDPEWDELVKLSLGERVHEGRRRGFILSRSALLECLVNNGDSPTINQLRIKDYSFLENYPRLTLSLSHTDGCGAAVVGQRNIFRSLGIDIERQNRDVKDSVIERIAHPMDESLRNIELWCLKEAVYKALMNSNLFSSSVEFSSIQIKDKYWLHPPSQLSGEWTLHSIDSFILAIASLKNEKLSPQDPVP